MLYCKKINNNNKINEVIIIITTIIITLKQLTLKKILSKSLYLATNCAVNILEYALMLKITTTATIINF